MGSTENSNIENVRVRLSNSTGLLKWVGQNPNEPGRVSSLTRRWSGPCGESESCADQVTSKTDGDVVFPWDLPLNTPLNLGFDVTYAGEKSSTVHTQTMTYLNCGEEPPNLDIMVPDPPKIADSPDTASAVFSAVRCSHKEGRHDRGEEIPIERVTAKLQPMEGCDDSKLSHEFSAPQSIVVGNKARVTMLRKRS
jgi:hypothetical protein